MTWAFLLRHGTDFVNYQSDVELTRYWFWIVDYNHWSLQGVWRNGARSHPISALKQSLRVAASMQGVGWELNHGFHQIILTLTAHDLNGSFLTSFQVSVIKARGVTDLWPLTSFQVRRWPIYDLCTGVVHVSRAAAKPGAVWRHKTTTSSYLQPVSRRHSDVITARERQWRGYDVPTWRLRERQSTRYVLWAFFNDRLCAI